MSKTEVLKWCLPAVVRSLDSGVVHVNNFEESEKKYYQVQGSEFFVFDGEKHISVTQFLIRNQNFKTVVKHRERVATKSAGNEVIRTQR